MTTLTEIDRIRALVEPIASDLDLDLYDVERRGATIRVTLDTPPGSDGGITLDNLALATRLISREIDHEDPIPGRFTLEVTSPGLERPLRTAAHYQREVGKRVTIRLRDPNAEPRRVEGDLVAADAAAATLRLDDDAERTIPFAEIDKARTVFVWGPEAKAAEKKNSQKAKKNRNSERQKIANTDTKTTESKNTETKNTETKNTETRKKQTS